VLARSGAWLPGARHSRPGDRRPIHQVMENEESPERLLQLLAAHCIRVEALTRGRAWLVADPPWPAAEVAAELVQVSAAALTR